MSSTGTAAAPSVYQGSQRILRVTPEAEGIFNVFLAAPPGFEYLPGQYVVISKEGLEDPRGPKRSFTLSSSPTEPGELRITTRKGPSPFKQFLETGAVGETVELRGPHGKFVLDPARDALLIAGGIGVTPFRSMLRSLVDRGDSRPVRLLHSVPTSREIAFRSELEAIGRTLPNVRVEFTVTREDADPSGWSGRTGRITAEWIRETLSALDRPKAYLSGPAAMVRGFRDLLANEVGFPAADVRMESFSGY